MTWNARTWPRRAAGVTPGERADPTLVLLHGWLGEARDWEPLVAALDGRFACLAFDLPGHGETPWPEDGLDLHTAARELGHSLTARGVRRYVVVGYSMGGRVALALAGSDPVGCTGVVLVSTSPGIQDQAERAGRAQVDLERAAALEADPSAFLQGWYRLALFGTLSASVDLELLAARRSSANIRGMARALVHLGPGRCAPAWWALHELDVPTLLIAGEGDPSYVAIAEEMATRLPDCRLVRIPGASHAVHLEAAGPLAAAVVARFGSRAASGA